MSLATEILVLRQQLLVLNRSVKRPKLRRRDRLFWVCLSSLWKDWREALIIVKPDTVIKIEYSQVYKTAIIGADALLLISTTLDEERLALLRRIAEEELGLDALVEAQIANEMLRAYATGATLIGVNNRNPSKFEVSFDISVEVARAAPEDVLLVSENGLRTKNNYMARAHSATKVS